MIISHDLLEKTCKNMIETILFCLDHATKGTIYRIGPMPELRSVRITSGIRDEITGSIHWGLPETSDYNPPGKTWEQYRDRPGHVLEAMGWCVERQMSWTADNPYEDLRSVRKQLIGEAEDCHHMEPVLVKKVDLYGEDASRLEYPVAWNGTPIWKDTEYVVVAVIKIHFRANTIRRGDRSTKVIKKLSHVLGTEMFSNHLRETLFQAREELTNQRFQSCNALAHELRNTLVKLSFIFSAINAEISYLREQWEEQLRKSVAGLEDKAAILGRLNMLILGRMHELNGRADMAQLSTELMSDQEELAQLPLLPEQSEQWLQHKILWKWERLLSQSDVWRQEEKEIHGLLERLKRALWIGTDPSLAERMLHIPEDIRVLWPKVVYTEFSPEKIRLLDDILRLLEHPQLTIPHKRQTLKILSSLKALAETIPDVEKRANKILFSLKNGNIADEGEVPPGDGGMEAAAGNPR